MAILASHAERYFVDDANTARIKTRQFAERLTVVVAERSGIKLEPQDTFSTLLGELRSADAVPRDVLDMLHRLRKDGNDALHCHAGERRLAFEALKLCHRLGVWLLATLTNRPGLTVAFTPPRLNEDDSAELKAEHDALLEEVARHQTDRDRTEQALAAAELARVDAEERARLAEEEREVFEALARDSEARAARLNAQPASSFVAAAFASARNMDLDEADTRVLVDEQLRQAGWEVDTSAIRYGKGARPEKA